jgi:uncharacterized protein (DUF58 family)
MDDATDYGETRRELISQVRSIELTTKVLVQGLMSGLHGSPFLGQGVEFAEIREYVPGDDIRTIDWKVTARYNRPFVREYTEDRDQTFYFVVDISGSGSFGMETTKRKKMLEVTASLAFAALRNNDRIGLCLVSDRVEKFIPAKRGRKHLISVINVLITHRARSMKTNIASAAKFLSTVLRRRSSIVVISDFVTPDPAKAIRILQQRHEIIAIRITDPRERALPDIRYIELEDPETGEQILVDTSDAEFRNAYTRIVRDEENRLSTSFRKSGIDEVRLMTSELYHVPLKQFFSARTRRRFVDGRIL